MNSSTVVYQDKVVFVIIIIWRDSVPSVGQNYYQSSKLSKGSRIEIISAKGYNLNLNLVSLQY